MARRIVLSALLATLFAAVAVAPAGAAATRLTTNEATDLGPVFSPDGNKIAFISDRPVEGSYSGNHVFVMNADGTGETNVSCPEGPCSHSWIQRPLSWAPDGSNVVFATGYGEIHRADAEGSGTTNLSTTPESWGRRPIYSANGSRIFYERYGCEGSCRNRISVMGDQGGNPHDVVPEGYNFDVSPAGGRLAYACLGGCSGGIHVVDTDGTGDRVLTGNEYDNFPTFSPDGNQIVFTRDWPGTHTADLFRINVDGTGLTRLTDDGRYSGGGVFDWSHDGSKIAYEWSTADESEFGVAVVEARDGSSRQIFGTPESDDGDPSFSPGSNKLAYFSDQNAIRNVDVYVETVYTAYADAAPLTTTTSDRGDGATASDPTTTSLYTPTGGTVSIEETASITQQAPSGFQFVGEQVNIEAPSSTDVTPLGITFRLDASLVPPGDDENTLQVFRNGVLVADCSGPDGIASPDPCVARRSLLADGDVELEVLSSHASAWNFGFRPIRPYLPGRMSGGGVLVNGSGERVRHNFDLACDATRGPNRLDLGTAAGTFSLHQLTEAVCHDDPSAGPATAPRAAFDTYSGAGSGVLDGVPAHAEWAFVDNGEQGRPDTGRVVIEDAAGRVVVIASGPVSGNYQAKG